MSVDANKSTGAPLHDLLGHKFLAVLFDLSRTQSKTYSRGGCQVSPVVVTTTAFDELHLSVLTWLAPRRINIQRDEYSNSGLCDGHAQTLPARTDLEVGGRGTCPQPG